MDRQIPSQAPDMAIRREQNSTNRAQRATNTLQGDYHPFRKKEREEAEMWESMDEDMKEWLVKPDKKKEKIAESKAEQDVEEKPAEEDAARKEEAKEEKSETEKKIEIISKHIEEDNKEHAKEE